VDDAARNGLLEWLADIKAVFVQDPKKRRHKLDAENHDSTEPTKETPAPHTVIYRIVGDMSFLSAMSHGEQLRNISSRKCVIISFRYCTVVDLDGIDQLGEVIDELRQRRRQTVLLCNMAAEVQKKFKLVHWFRAMKEDGLLFEHTREAVQHLQGLGENVGSQDVAVANLKLDEQANSLNLAEEN